MEGATACEIATSGYRLGLLGRSDEAPALAVESVLSPSGSVSEPVDLQELGNASSPTMAASKPFSQQARSVQGGHPRAHRCRSARRS